MSETNNTIKSNKNQYHHLTLDDRTKIQSLIEQVDDEGRRIFSNSYIADYIGVHKSTISRELKRIKSKIVNGKIKCRKSIKLNVDFPTFLLIIQLL